MDKVFKKSVDPSLDSWALTLFEGQCDAFGRAAKDAVMMQHTPLFYGACVIEDVIGCAGNSTEVFAECRHALSS